MKNIIKTILEALYPNKFILRRVANSNEKVAITFDDGPHPVNTKKLLKVLKNAGIKATFFVSGAEVKKYPELITAIKEAGHEMGSHSFFHKKISEIGFDAYCRDAEKVSLLIKDCTGVKVDLYRPPFGELNFSIYKFIVRNDLRYVGWTLDSKDSFIRNKQRLIDSMKRSHIKVGDIVLFHEDYDSTIDAIEQIIADIKKRGFKPVTVSELGDKRS